MSDVIRAEDFYTPPPSLPADAWATLPGAERAITWFEHTAQRRLPRPARDQVDDDPLFARIDAGRWVAQCPCGSAQVVTPTDPRMYCVECLDHWNPLVFPDDVEAAEQAVADLPARQRFWWHPDDPSAQPGQTEV